MKSSEFSQWDCDLFFLFLLSLRTCFSYIIPTPHHCVSCMYVEGMCLLVYKSQNHQWPLSILESTVLHPDIGSSCWL